MKLEIHSTVDTGWQLEQDNGNIETVENLQQYHISGFILKEIKTTIIDGKTIYSYIFQSTENSNITKAQGYT